MQLALPTQFIKTYVSSGANVHDDVAWLVH